MTTVSVRYARLWLAGWLEGSHSQPSKARAAMWIPEFRANSVNIYHFECHFIGKKYFQSCLRGNTLAFESNVCYDYWNYSNIFLKKNTFQIIFISFQFSPPRTVISCNMYIACFPKVQTLLFYESLCSKVILSVCKQAYNSHLYWKHFQVFFSIYLYTFLCISWY